MTKINRIIMAILLLGASSVVCAENRPGAVTLSVSEAYYNFAGKRHIDNTGMPNAAIAYNFDQHWAVEGGVGLINTMTKSSNMNPNEPVHGFLYTADGLYRFMPYKRFEPYVLAGVGILGLKPNGVDPLHQGNVNAGLGTQWFIDQSIALRAEARDIYTMSGGKNDYMLNFGISLLFDEKACPRCH